MCNGISTIDETMLENGGKGSVKRRSASLGRGLGLPMQLCARDMRFHSWQGMSAHLRRSLRAGGQDSAMQPAELSQNS